MLVFDDILCFLNLFHYVIDIGKKCAPVIFTVYRIFFIVMHDCIRITIFFTKISNVSCIYFFHFKKMLMLKKCDKLDLYI